MKEAISETISLQELAERYHLKLSTLRRWASERRFPLYRISNRIRVSPLEFSEWLQQFKVNKKGGKDDL
ncbi:MAG: helix-turn-helix domain-containing protein [Ignavibacteriales bacterium]